MTREKVIKIIKTVLIVIFSVTFVISTYGLIKGLSDYHKANSTYQDMQDSYVQPNEDQEEAKDPYQQTESAELPISVDFDALLARNPDVVGWLYCPGTAINYPVVKGKDNEQYLYTDLDGNYLVSGTLFADYRNDPLGVDDNYIIYGHNMKNGSMFHSLVKYAKQSYYDEHPTIFYLTPDANYKIELFAGLTIKHNDAIYKGRYEGGLYGFLQSYIARSTFVSDVDLTETDTVVTLSTCTFEFDNARYIVIGRLTPA